MEKTQVKKGTFVISTFPGCGKSYCSKNYQEKFCILDIDSSNYRYIKDENGKNTDERNPKFPMNNMQRIKENIGKADVIFVSSITTMRKALKDDNIKVIMVYPAKDMKEEFIRRYKDRGNDEKFRNFLSDNWDNFLDEMEEEDYGFFKDKLTKDSPFINLSYLESLFNDLTSEWLNYESSL